MEGTRRGPDIRRIRPDEGLRLRALRLRALADAPMAFGATLAEEEALPEGVWHTRAVRSASGIDQVTYIAEQADRWVGIATGLADGWNGSRPALVGMFVEPAARGRGVGAALVDSVTAWARDRGAARLYLWVTSTNHPAIALYLQCGFRPTGEAKSLHHTPALTELQMVREVA